MKISIHSIVFITSLLFISSASAQLVDTLSLESFLGLARQQNIGVEAAKLDRNQAELDFQLVQASLRPNLTANANLPNFARTSREVLQPDGTIKFQRISNNNSALGLSLTQNIAQTGGFFFVRSDIQRFDDFESEFTQYNGVPIRVGLFQPLLGFNDVKWSKNLAPIRLQEANKKYLSDLESIYTDATRLFFNLVIARMNLDIANSNFTNNQSLYEIAKERHALGKISDSELMQLQVSLLNAQRSQRSAQQSVRLVSSNIYAFLGTPYDGKMLASRLPEVTEPLSVDYQEALQYAQANRFEQDGFQRMTMEAERDVAQAKGTGGFQADLNASFGLTRAAPQLGEIYQSPQDEQFVQVTLSVPILDWGAQKSRVQIAKAQQSYTREFVKQERIRFETEIRQAVDQFETIQQELQLAKQLRDLAQDRFDIAKQSFVLGAISITELTIAQQEKDQALRSYVSALSQYWQNYYQLRSLTLFDFKTGQQVN